jgi:hypothetical protein
LCQSFYSQVSFIAFSELLLCYFRAWLDSSFLGRLAPDFFEGIMDGCLAHLW